MMLMMLACGAGFWTDRLPLMLMMLAGLGLMPGLVPNDAHNAGLGHGFWLVLGLMPGLVPNDADDAGLRRGFFGQAGCL